jgi:glycosyltransferase involved in cell wall biosynthesis
VAFVTDIITPYGIAVHRELARMVDLTVLYAATSGSRAMDWSFDDVPFRHIVVGGATVRRRNPDGIDLHASPRLLRLLSRIRPDAIISSAFSLPSAYAALYGAARGVPLLIYSDGTAASEAGFNRMQRLARKVLVPRAAGAIAKSEPAAANFERLGFAPADIFRALHSTGIAPFQAVGRVREPGESGRLTVLATGRLIARKALDRLIEAYALARRERPGITLTIAGDGPERAALEALGRARGVPVDFRGFVQQEGLPPLFAEADAYAFPTLRDPFGIVVLEAAAAALPIVASPRAGATADIIRDGLTGLVRDPEDVTGWADALVRLADDPALRHRLGTAAHEATIDRTPENTARGYADAVATVVRRNGHPGRR